MEAEIRICPRPSPDACRVACVAGAPEEASLETVLVDGFPIKQDGGRQTRFVEKQLADGDIPLVRIEQERQIIRRPVGQTQTALVIELHHSQERGAGFGHRSNIVDVSHGHRHTIRLGDSAMGAERLGIDFITILHHHDLASGISPLRNALFGDAVDDRKAVGIHAQIPERAVGLRGHFQCSAFTDGKPVAHRSREASVCPRLARQDGGHPLLDVLIGSVRQEQSIGCSAETARHLMTGNKQEIDAVSLGQIAREKRTIRLQVTVGNAEEHPFVSLQLFLQYLHGRGGHILGQAEGIQTDITSKLLHERRQRLRIAHVKHSHPLGSPVERQEVFF